MKWFRFYSEVLDDPKVQRLPFEMRWRWAELLCLANGGSPRGRLPSTADIGYRLRVPEAKAKKVVMLFLECGLLDEIDGRLVPHNWDERQPGSDNAKERMRRTRSENVPNKFGLEEKENRTEENRTEQNRGEGEGEGDALVALYEDTFGCPIPNGTVAQRLVDAEKEYGRECLEHSLKAAAEANVRDWRYVKKILERHEREGCNDDDAPADPQVAWLEHRYREGKARLEAV